jgi:two-component system, NarL family, sensor histidine kinase UhpB
VIWDWNLQTREIYVNDKIKEIFGYGQKDVSVEWFVERLHPEEKERVREDLVNAIKSGFNNWELEFRLKDAKDQYRHALAKGFILFDADGMATRMIGSITDITEKRRLEQQLLTQQLDHQKLITENTIQAQEKEREELGKELHDNINQVLATVKMFLDMAKSNVNMRMDLVNRSHENVAYAIEEIRKLSKSLVAPSLGDIGLKEALEELAEEINFTRGLKVVIEYDYKKRSPLDAGLQLMLYRIAQEQLNNVVKYAKATTTTISLKSEDDLLHVSIADNGLGFDPKKKAKGIGLKNITSRVEFYNGKIDVVSAPGQGCKIQIDIPLKES